MPIINTNDYNVYLDISDDFNVVLTTFTSKDVSNLDQFIDNFSVPDENSIIILWGAVNRIYPDHQIIQLNEFYNSIKNPLVVFTGILDLTKSNFLDFHWQGINLFQHIAKISQPQNRLIVFKKSKKYLFMSSKDYLSRRYILQHLLNNGFENQGVIAYKCLQKLFNEPFGDNIKYIKDACESINTQIPIVGFDGPLPNYDKVPEDIINDTYLSIITETYYQGPIYFSEKIYYAMLYNHFFIYLGPTNSLKYLRSLGFKTFGHIVDESYDDIYDPAERLFAVTKSMDEFISKPLSEIEQLYAENIDIINHNRQLISKIDINETINSALRFAISIR
jgi:hypothetical protein